MMPMVDGFATLETKKRRTVAPLSRKKRKKKGISLGANLYVTKSPFEKCK
jgi:hypothetical protein